MTSACNREQLAYLLATATAILLISAIVALAATADAPPPASVSHRVWLELNQPNRYRAVFLPGPILQDGGAEAALKQLAAEQHCLAEVIYFEARGESEAGQRAVAEVILHRLKEGTHGHTVCEVVYEGAGQTFCQFTFACDGSTEDARLAGPRRTAQVLAARMLAGEVPADETHGATYYHSLFVHPSWVPAMRRAAQIGNHIFYRDAVTQDVPVIRGSLQ